MSKWNWAWQPWLPQASSVATAPNPRFCQPSLESGTPRLCCRAEVGRCTSAWGLQTPTSRGRMQGGGVLHLCGSYGLAACISQYDFRWTSRHSEPFGQNSLKMACLSYSHSGFFNPASLFTWKIPENNNSWLQWNRIRAGLPEPQNYWVIWDLLEC